MFCCKTGSPLFLCGMNLPAKVVVTVPCLKVRGMFLANTWNTVSKPVDSKGHV